MNLLKVKDYLTSYKENFNKVHQKEIYKWEAVKLFQENFDVEAIDFYENLEKSLAKTSNLLKSGNYFAHKMLLDNTKKTPEKVRECFKELYNEGLDIPRRVENFRKKFTEISSENYPTEKLNHYQDHRAVVVYLSLRYPERYFLYKFGMFKNFALKIGYEEVYKPVKGKIQNVTRFNELCEKIRYLITNDQELIFLHKERLNKDCYFDTNLNILTQDFIYAVVRHLETIEFEETKQIKTQKIDFQTEIILAKALESKVGNVDFTPKITNFIQNNIENKRIGDLGEEFVFRYEQAFLRSHNKLNLAKKVKHVAKEQGDGLGYDILSYDLNEKLKYIEVKTTKGKVNTVFYVTRNELEKSRIEQENYFLYRLYDFDEENGNAEILKIQGDLSQICTTPVSYKVNLEQQTT